MTSSSLISAIGKSTSASGTKDLLAQYGLPVRPKTFPRDEEYTGLNSEANGISVNYLRSEYAPSHISDALPEGDVVLYGIFLYREGIDGFHEFKGEIPFGLRFTLTRSEARQLLGAPEWTSPITPKDRWIVSNLKLLATYSDDEKSIDTISFHLNK
jgi:hypothetical protein